MNQLRATPQQIQQWDIIHRFCQDNPGEITDLDEARRVLTTHAEHGPECRQYLAALSRASEVAA